MEIEQDGVVVDVDLNNCEKLPGTYQLDDNGNLSKVECLIYSMTAVVNGTLIVQVNEEASKRVVKSEPDDRGAGSASYRESMNEHDRGKECDKIVSLHKETDVHQSNREIKIENQSVGDSCVNDKSINDRGSIVVTQPCKSVVSPDKNSSISVVRTEIKEIKEKEDANEPKCWKCETCFKEFKMKDSLMRHQYTHNGQKPFKCHLCDKRFFRNEQLKRHLSTHTGDKKVICDQCNKGFSSSVALKRHTLSHNNIYPFACDECEKKFTSRFYLKRHQLNHGEKAFVCDVCEKRFARKDRLKEHRLSHDIEKPFACKLCNKSFIRRDYLRDHKLNRFHKKKEVELGKKNGELKETNGCSDQPQETESKVAGT